MRQPHFLNSAREPFHRVTTPQAVGLPPWAARPPAEKPDPHLKGHPVTGTHNLGMNATIRSVLESLLTDPGLSDCERRALQSALADAPCADTALHPLSNQSLLLSQKQVAEYLGVNRTTVWRLEGMQILRPTEISPGTKRYEKSQVETLAREGYRRLLTSAKLRPAA